MQPDFRDFDAVRREFGAHLGLNILHDFDAALRKKGRQIDAAEFPAHRRVHHLRQLRARLGKAVQGLVKAQRVDDAEARIGLGDNTFLIAENHLLRRRLQQQQPRIVDDHRVDEGRLEFQPRLVDDADWRAEPHDQRALPFVDGEDRGQADKHHDGGQSQKAKGFGVHLPLPSRGAGGGLISLSGMNGASGAAPLPDESRITREDLRSIASTLSR